MATSWPSMVVTHGTTDAVPEADLADPCACRPGRSGTATRRTTVGSASRIGMQSVIRTVPSGRSNSVSSTRVSPTYRRRVASSGSPSPGRDSPPGRSARSRGCVSPSRWAKQAASRSAGGTASRSSRRGRRAQRYACRRSGRSPRFGASPLHHCRRLGDSARRSAPPSSEQLPVLASRRRERLGLLDPLQHAREASA